MASGLPKTMRAVQFTRGQEQTLSLSNNVPLPSSAHGTLPKGQTLVKVAYAALNPVDYKFFASPFGLLFPGSRVTGLDFSGTVVRTSRSDLQPGQRVFGKTDPPAFGSLAEYVVVGPEGCVAIPDDRVTLEQASGLGVCALTAYQCIAPFVNKERKGVDGERVLIIGASGGTGTFGIQIAKVLGLHVTTVCSGANADLCRSLGADVVIDYKTQNVVEELKTMGKTQPFDLMVDNVGSDLGLYYNAHQYLKPDGRYVIIGGHLSFKYFRDVIAMLFVPAWLGGGSRKVQFNMALTNAAHYKQIAEWMAEGKVKMVLEEMVELDDVLQGFERLKTGRTRGKIVVKVGTD